MLLLLLIVISVLQTWMLLPIPHFKKEKNSFGEGGDPGLGKFLLGDPEHSIYC